MKDKEYIVIIQEEHDEPSSVVIMTGEAIKKRHYEYKKAGFVGFEYATIYEKSPCIKSEDNITFDFSRL